MPVNVEQCPACGNSIPVRVTRLDEVSKAAYLDYSKAKYAGFIDDWLEQIDVAIDGCSQCGHHWYREQPDNSMLLNMYAKGRPLSPSNGVSPRDATPVMIREMHRLKKLVNVLEPRLLDYGSGFGKWARAAVQVGFKVTAYEPSVERGLEQCKIGFTLVHDVNDLKSHCFDVINLEQVLEHVPDPIVLLKELHGYCKADTLVRITVPNVLRCPEGNKIWSEWPYNGTNVHTMAPFEHLQGFTPKSLRIAAIRAEFKPANSLRIWLKYPKEMIRSYVGKFFPKLGQTSLLLTINNINK
jgi:SAM-dependent methyltransferase